jgi:hypothetical protein
MLLITAAAAVDENTLYLRIAGTGFLVTTLKLLFKLQQKYKLF